MQLTENEQPSFGPLYFENVGHTRICTERDDVYICQSVHKNNRKLEQLFYILVSGSTFVLSNAITHTHTG